MSGRCTVDESDEWRPIADASTLSDGEVPWDVRRRLEIPGDTFEASHSDDIVRLNLYDMNESVAPLNLVAVDFLGLGGALHAGVEVFGEEWSYGTSGVAVNEPRKNTRYAYRQTIFMGHACIDRAGAERAIRCLRKEWLGCHYDLLTRNCCSFAEELCLRLGVGGLPSWVNRLAETGGNLAVVRGLVSLLGGCAASSTGWSSPARSTPSGTGHSSPETPQACWLGTGKENVPPEKGGASREHLAATPESVKLRKLPKARCSNFSFDSQSHSLSLLVPGYHGEFEFPVNSARQPLSERSVLSINSSNFPRPAASKFDAQPVLSARPLGERRLP